MKPQNSMGINLKAPFPYFGGKSLIADKVWSYLGDVKQYIEPFFGSGVVLLKRPPTKHKKFYEIVKDDDGFIANVWRSIEFSPDETAKWADWPVNHADLNARRKVLLNNEVRLIDNLQNDDIWHDPKLAGYWIWAASCWIGSGLTRPSAIPHLIGDRDVHSQRPHITHDQGIHSKIPHLTRDRGVHSQIPDLTGSRGLSSQPATNVYVWISELSARLRNVKVVCGDWTRVCGGNWQDYNKPVGMFFDPPYATSGRNENIYHHDSMTIAKDVETWVSKRGDNPNYRIVVAGYDDEYVTLMNKGWKSIVWSAGGGYSNRNTRGNTNRHRERLFISPFCEGDDNDDALLF